MENPFTDDEHGLEQEAWDEIVTPLADAGNVQPEDKLACKELCRWYAAYRKAMNAGKTAEAAKCWDRWTKLAESLGWRNMGGGDQKPTKGSTPTTASDPACEFGIV